MSGMGSVNEVGVHVFFISVMVVIDAGTTDDTEEMEHNQARPVKEVRDKTNRKQGKYWV